MNPIMTEIEMINQAIATHLKDEAYELINDLLDKRDKLLKTVFAESNIEDEQKLQLIEITRNADKEVVSLLKNERDQSRELLLSFSRVRKYLIHTNE